MAQRTSFTGLGPVIRELRIERGVSQAELARGIRRHPKYMAKVEYGTRNPSEVTLVRIAKLLEIDVRKLKASAAAPDAEVAETAA